MKKVTQKRVERGAILVEFAILLPFLILMTFGIIEFGLLFYNKQVLTNASREGARSGIARHDVNGDLSFTKQDIIDAVDIYLGLGPTDTVNDRRLLTFGSFVNPVVNVTGDGGNAGEDLTVKISYDYSFLIPGLFGLGTSMKLNAETVMSMERVL